MKAQEIYKVEDLVRVVLAERPETRGDDFYLVAEVYAKIVEPLTIYTMSFYDFLADHIELGLPPFETITRIRRKLQAEDPSLRANQEVTILRFNEQQGYEEYGLDK